MLRKDFGTFQTSRPEMVQCFCNRHRVQFTTCRSQTKASLNGAFKSTTLAINEKLLLELRAREYEK